jgi:hypothetical protein
MLGAPRWLSAAVAAAAAAVSASPLLPPPPSCNLQGNWTTSGVHPDPLRAALVHIEILQPEGSLDFTVKADWPGHAGFATAGRLAAGGASAWVYMVAPSGGVWDSSPVTASAQNSTNRRAGHLGRATPSRRQYHSCHRQRSYSVAPTTAHCRARSLAGSRRGT